MRAALLRSFMIGLGLLTACISVEAEPDQLSTEIRRCTRKEDCAQGELCDEERRCVPIPPPSCGNGVKESGEECDQGEASSHNGECTRDCTLARCGDGLVWLEHEQCDDGNDEDEDFCKRDCQLNVCGDGIPGGPGEGCDDGNNDNDDGCTVRCTTPDCPDGFVNDDSEQCDDGNSDDRDGCLSNCELAYCGDRFLYEGVEECDDGPRDGNTGNRDTGACTSSCKRATCGDGFVREEKEECDDGRSCGDEARTPCERDADCAGKGDGRCKPRGGDGCNELCEIEDNFCCIPGYGCLPELTISPDNSCAHCISGENKTDWSPNDGTPCSGNKCLLNQTCSSFACIGGQPRNCSDNNVCTTDACDPELPGDGCFHTPLPDDTPKDDGLYCNGADYCEAGVLRHSGSPCPANEPACIESTDRCERTGAWNARWIRTAATVMRAPKTLASTTAVSFPTARTAPPATTATSARRTTSARPACAAAPGW